MTHPVTPAIGDAKSVTLLDVDDPLTDAEKALLDARLAAYKRNPDAGSSWAEVEARIRARLTQ
jgi:putative addiction module component (TIGR02574 family)